MAKAKQAKHRGVGAIIADLRGSIGMSQEELAHRASLHRTHIGQIERGLKSPTIATLQRIAKALNTTAGKILRLSEDDKG